MEITVGHTPDVDDAFMFYAMLNKKLPARDFEITQVVQDIEKLNQRAGKGDLDVTAISVHTCAFISGYTILRSGGSFGLGYGPIVATRKGFDVESLQDVKIAVPGKMTSAFLLLQLMIGKFEYKEINFSDIPQAVANGTVDAGLIIHEAQITFEQYGIEKILDTGKWWNDITGGLPVPLGINVMKSSLGADTIQKFDAYLQESIQYGLDHAADALSYATKYGRDTPEKTLDRFVKMYVNPVTVDMGDRGEVSIRKLFEMAKMKGLVSDFDLTIADR